jgi:hypothetical protein
LISSSNRFPARLHEAIQKFFSNSSASAATSSGSRDFFHQSEKARVDWQGSLTERIKRLVHQPDAIDGLSNALLSVVHKIILNIPLRKSD